MALPLIPSPSQARTMLGLSQPREACQLIIRVVLTLRQISALRKLQNKISNRYQRLYPVSKFSKIIMLFKNYRRRMRTLHTTATVKIIYLQKTTISSISKPLTWSEEFKGKNRWRLKSSLLPDQAHRLIKQMMKMLLKCRRLMIKIGYKKRRRRRIKLKLCNKKLKVKHV